jgi:hypothetical protein
MDLTSRCETSLWVPHFACCSRGALTVDADYAPLSFLEFTGDCHNEKESENGPLTVSIAHPAKSTRSAAPTAWILQAENKTGCATRPLL